MEKQCDSSGGDLDCSGIVDDQDYNFLIQSLGSSDSAADLDKSGWVDTQDIQAFLKIRSNQINPTTTEIPTPSPEPTIVETTLPPPTPTIIKLSQKSNQKKMSETLVAASKIFAYILLISALITILAIIIVKIKLWLVKQKQNSAGQA